MIDLFGLQVTPDALIKTTLVRWTTFLILELKLIKNNSVHTLSLFVQQTQSTLPDLN